MTSTPPSPHDLVRQAYSLVFLWIAVAQDPDEYSYLVRARAHLGDALQALSAVSEDPGRDGSTRPRI